MALNINQNLPPIEFCSIVRAANLLECEFSDILHWWELGNIGLCVLLNEQKGKLIVHGNSRAGALKHLIKRKQKNFSLKRRAIFSVFARKEFKNDEVEIIKKHEKNGDLIVTCGLTGYISGLWGIIGREKNHYIYTEDTIITINGFLSPVFLNKGKYIQRVNFSLDTEISIKAIDLVITKTMIEQLINSKGKEMPNFINKGKSLNETSNFGSNIKKGKPANYYREFIIAVVKETRNIYPHCIMAKLINAIYELLISHDPTRTPTKGAMRNILISQGIGKTGLETKESFELIIPEQYKNELNNLM